MVLLKDPDTVFQFNFHGNGSELFGIFLRNVFFIILTLGVFVFWGKVETRKYLWGQSSLKDDRFCYHGTGMELLFGWLKAFVVFGGWFVLLSSVYVIFEEPIADLLVNIPLYVGLWILIPIAQFGAIRYRFSRTSWRGIRFSFRGRFWPFLKLSLRGLFFTGLTLGFYFPEYHRQVRSFTADNMYFGSVKLGFDGQEGIKLWRLHRNALLISLASAPAIGIWLVYGPWEYRAVGIIGFLAICLSAWVISWWSWVQYLAERRRYYWKHTFLGKARFKSMITDKSLFLLYAGNFILTVVTLGIARPWVRVRSIQYDLQHLRLEGDIDFNQVVQEAQKPSATGDELGGLLELDSLVG